MARFSHPVMPPVAEAMFHTWLLLSLNPTASPASWFRPSVTRLRVDPGAKERDPFTFAKSHPAVVDPTVPSALFISHSYTLPAPKVRLPLVSWPLGLLAGAGYMFAPTITAPEPKALPVELLARSSPPVTVVPLV